jgi:hypothetical protein
MKRRNFLKAALGSAIVVPAIKTSASESTAYEGERAITQRSTSCPPYCMFPQFVLHVFNSHEGPHWEIGDIMVGYFEGLKYFSDSIGIPLNACNGERFSLANWAETSPCNKNEAQIRIIDCYGYKSYPREIIGLTFSDCAGSFGSRFVGGVPTSLSAMKSFFNLDFKDGEYTQYFKVKRKGIMHRLSRTGAFSATDVL